MGKMYHSIESTYSRYYHRAKLEELLCNLNPYTNGQTRLSHSV